MTDRAPASGQASFQRANDESRERLASLISTLTPTQLAIDLGEGWTVASALAHTGFWDRWHAVRWAEMLAGRWTADDASIIAAEHLADDALHPYWSGIDATDVPALALEAATTLDALVVSAPDALIDAVLAGPSAYLVNRFRHRGEHIDHIERSLAAAAPAPVGRDFVERNAASRKHLASLVERLRESDMALITEEGGWTVAQALAHVAFWDRSTASRWRVAQAAAAEGKALDPFGIPYDLLEGINPPLAEMVGAWAGRLGSAIGREALAAAEEIDAIIESLADSLPDSLIAEKPNAVARWPHREAHIEQIERALAEGRSSAAPVDRSYIARNGSSLTRLQYILARLSQADLDRRCGERRCGERQHGARQSGEGPWTVGQILGHLTFWDRFLAARWRAAQAGGPGEQPSFLPHELADLLNDGLPATWQAFASASAESAIAETLAAAQEIDGIIADLPQSAPIEAILAQRPALLDRSIHRLEHLATIERAIGGRSTTPRALDIP